MRQQLIVSLDNDTGPVFHGASGALYGLSDDGVPGADLLAPLHIRTISQKPPGGLQHDGYHRVSVAGSGGNFLLLAGGTELGTGTMRTFGKDSIVYLHAGINRIDCLPAGQTAVIDSLDVIPDAASDAEWAMTYPAAAAGNVLSGTATTAANAHAHGGQHVGWIGNGAGNLLTFTGIAAPWRGAYRVMLSYACNERTGSDNYNVNLINRGVTVATSAGSRLTACARNTYSWNQFNTVELTVRLAAGTVAITFGNPSAYAPDIDKITVAPVLLP